MKALEPEGTWASNKRILHNSGTKALSMHRKALGAHRALEPHSQKQDGPLAEVMTRLAGFKTVCTRDGPALLIASFLNKNGPQAILSPWELTTVFCMQAGDLLRPEDFGPRECT